MFLWYLSFLFFGVFTLGGHVNAELKDLGTVTRDTGTGLDWLDMSLSKNVPAAQIMAGTDPTCLRCQGWRHATLSEIETLLINAGMTPPFGGSSPGNFAGAQLVINLLDTTGSNTNLPCASNEFIQAFAGEGPPSPSGYLYTPVVLTGICPTGTAGGADLPGPVVPSSVANPTIGNWLVKPSTGGDGPPETEPRVLFWSMCVGNFWVYDGSDLGGGSWTTRDEIVGSNTTTIPGVKTYRVETSKDGVAFGYTWYSISLTEVKEWQEILWDDVGYGPEWIRVSSNSGLIWAKNPVLVGEHWITTTDGTISGSTGWSIPTNISLDVTVQDHELINAPLGSYKAYKVRQIVHIWNYDYGIDETNTQYGWFVPYLGIVKLQDESNNSMEVLSSMSIKKGIVDFGLDAKTDLAIYRVNTGAWFVNPSGGGSPYGIGFGGDPSDYPVAGDYDGDGRTDIAIYRTATGAWFINPSGGGEIYGVGFGGDASDIPLPFDYDGDAKSDIAIYRKSIGAWFIFPSSTGPSGIYGVGFGGDPSDIPVPADYDGDGKADIAIYRKSTGAWFIYPSSTGPSGIYGVGFGGDASDIPVPGDYDGDGKKDIAIYRANTGAWFIYPSSAGSSGIYGVGFGGDITDKPVPGDYDGDGKTDLAIYRANTGSWFIYPSSTGSAGIYGVGFGGDASDLPVVTNPAAYI
jgi:hypothetical protein